jgi:ribose transport system permease protein
MEDNRFTPIGDNKHPLGPGLSGSAWAGAMESEAALLAQDTTTTTDTESRPHRALPSARAVRYLPRLGTVFGLFVLYGVFAIARPSTFPTWSNTLTILDQGSLLAIIAGGLTVCLILGEFDLSIGYTATLGGAVAALVLNDGVSPVLVVILALATGFLVGLLNGLVVAYGGVNAFIVTLGSGSVVYGIVLGLTGGAGVEMSRHSLAGLGQDTVATVPVPVIICVVIIMLLWVFINKTEVGRRVDAVGGNSTAALLSGVRVKRIRLLGFLISGTAAAAVGIILAGQLGAAYADSGTPYLLEAFTACFLGAVTLRDNEFNIAGTAIGVLIIAVTFNGLVQLGVSAFWQNVAQGTILILAVLIPRFVPLVRRLPLGRHRNGGLSAGSIKASTVPVSVTQL